MFENNRILIVEDTARSLITIASFLKDLGVSYKRNTTGFGVLSQAISLQPDLIMLNIDLVDADAMAICRSLRQDPRTQHIPVIATAEVCPTSGVILQLQKNGFTDCLCKPFSKYLVNQMLGRYLNNHSAAGFAHSSHSK